ncbi:hypothetical protein L9F63_021700, partial [Diploptera punctata]
CNVQSFLLLFSIKQEFLTSRTAIFFKSICHKRITKHSLVTTSNIVYNLSLADLSENQ